MMATTMTFVEKDKSQKENIEKTKDMLKAMELMLKAIHSDLIVVRENMNISLAYGGNRKDVEMGNIRFDCINNKFTWCNRNATESDRVKELYYRVGDVIDANNKMLLITNGNKKHN